MERYDNVIKLEEIRKFTEENQYKKAEKVLDTLDLHKIKSLTDLSIIADVYTQNERYEEAIKVLSKMYAKTKARRILYQLVEVTIKQGNIQEAEKYLEQYIKVAPNDSYRFIFRYCIDKRMGKPNDVLIYSLEQLKEYEYIENWAYELAKLYHKSGMKDKCIRECSDIALWFGEGIYVEKAKLLKAYYVGELDPITMLKAKDKKEAEQRLGLDKTKDFSSVRSQIDSFLAEEEVINTFDVVIDHSIEDEIKNITNEDELDEKIQEYILSEEITTEVKPTETELVETGSKETGSTETESIEAESKEAESKEAESKEAESKEAESIEAESIEMGPEEEESTEAAQFDGESIDVLAEVFSGTNIEYKKILGYFYEVCKSEIAEAILAVLFDEIKNTSLVICGENGTGKTTLAKKISQIIYEADRISSTKVAKINGSKLNNVDLQQKADTLRDCTLIIEGAGALNYNAVQQLLWLIGTMDGHLLVVLEDTKAKIDQLMDQNSNLKAEFKHTIHLPEYRPNDLFGFAISYIDEHDYQLTEEAIGILLDKLNEITVGKAKDEQLSETISVVKNANKAADIRNRNELLKVIGEREMQSTDFMYVTAEDFC